MNLLDRLKNWLDLKFNIKVFRYSLPKGVDLAYDLTMHRSVESIKVVMDVGANVGQSAKKFARQFPSAQIHSFEPVRRVFDELKDQTGKLHNIQAHNFALGDVPGFSKMNVGSDEYCGINSFVNEIDNGLTEMVEIRTLSEFCKSHAISRIDILKIDVEGFELSVLGGARELLEKRLVDFLLIETELRDSHTIFVPQSRLDDFLRPMGYEIFGVYDQTRDEKRNKHGLYFLNIAYFHESSFRKDV